MLVTLDLVGVPRDLSVPVCAEITKKYRLERSQVVLATSHTHTGPVVGGNLESMYFLTKEQHAAIERYAKFLHAAIVRAVDEASAKLAPGTLAWAHGKATFAVNRRNNPEKKVPELRAANKLRGPIDHDAPVLRVRDAKGKDLAVVFGYACHATVLSFYQWTGDYPGFAQAAFEKRHPGTVAMFWAGCGADQNPLPRRKVELATEYGERLSKSVDRVLEGKLETVNDDHHLKTRYEEIDLRLAKIPTREDVLADSKSKNKYIVGRARVLQKQLDAGGIPATYPYPIQAWRIGSDVRWIFLGGEVVVDYSLRLKRELGARGTWVAAYCNDVMAYIPSERVLKEGGYEGDTSMIYYGLPSKWAPGLEDQIVGKIRELCSD